MRDDEFDAVQDISKKKKEKRGSFFGTLFLIWFLASLILMTYFSKKNTYYLIMVFGQYFLVFGIMAFKACKGTEKLIALLVIAMGLGAIIIPYIQMHPELGIQL